MLFRLLHFLFGYYKISARGNFPERFFNLCNKNNIIIWKLRLKGRDICFQVGLLQLKKVKELLGKTNMELCNCRMCGLPAGLFSYRKRYALFLGGAFFLGSLWYLSSFIWAIEITPAKNVDTVMVLEKLESLGLREGAKKTELDLDEIYQDMLLDTPEISWIAINIRGTKAVVEARARIMPPEMESNTPCDIIASRDGQIILMEVYEGKAVIKNKTAVQKGDLLVTGRMENTYTGEVRYVPARAKVLAVIYSKLMAKIPLNATKERYTGQSVTRHGLQILNFTINLSPFSSIKSDNYDKIIMNHQLRLGSLYLPAIFYEEVYREWESFTVQISEEEAMALCEKEISRQQALLSSENFTIEDKDARIENGEAIIEVYLACQQDIGIREEIIIEGE